MAFERKGTPMGKISVLKYNIDKESDVLCPNCSAVIAKKDDNGIKRVASMKIVGSLSMKCPKCDAEISV